MRRILSLAVAAVAASSCSSQPGTPDLGPSTFSVQVTAVDGNTTLPTSGSPLPVSNGTTVEQWAFSIQAVSPTGDPLPFNGMVGLHVVPGTVTGISGNGTSGVGSIMVTNGTAQGTVGVTAVYGDARLWVEDLGYVPAPPDRMTPPPACSNGKDDNDNHLVDWPSDPGCYAADDDTEDGGTYAAGASQAVWHHLPKISDVRGPTGSRTPFPNEAVNIAASDPENLVVTAVVANGFFVTDMNPTEVARGYNSLYVFNFSTPPNMRVCDKITQLRGTTNDFYGFTELSFPSWVNTYVILPADAGVPPAGTPVPGCIVPEPHVLPPDPVNVFTGVKDTTAAALYPYEGSLVRIEGWETSEWLGSTVPTMYRFGPGTTNCDFNGDGVIDYTQLEGNGNCPAGQCEGACVSLCNAEPRCSEWNDYAQHNGFKMHYPACPPLTPSNPNCNTPGQKQVQVLVDTSAVSTFNPFSQTAQKIDAFTGNLREFSGGTLNFTIAARCSDDVVCAASLGCTTQVAISSTAACVRARTTDDNDQGTD